MGRELKRVSKDFTWELNKIWKGYINSATLEEPPAGKYYQLWETVSEGSPVSPAFKTKFELAKYLAKVKHLNISDYNIWLHFLNNYTWSVSSVGTNGKLMSGVEYLYYKDKDKGKI